MDNDHPALSNEVKTEGNLSVALLRSPLYALIKRVLNIDPETGIEKEVKNKIVG